LADQEQAFSWSSTLCKEWMQEAPEEAAVLYVDGHVRVYHGTTKVLPKHYVARERLTSTSIAPRPGATRRLTCPAVNALRLKRRENVTSN
jgi:hypothetical protein